MTRIIGGSAGGRRLRTPSGDRTRPTSDRVREALFSALESEHGNLLGAGFLDLYAGSGALGLEAASRGATTVVCVESDRSTARLIARNADDLALTCRVVAQPVGRWLRTAAATPFDIVVADPPYPLANDAVAEVLALLAGGGWLAEGATVVVERSTRSTEPQWPEGIRRVRCRDYGETVLWYLRAGSRSSASRG